MKRICAFTLLLSALCTGALAQGGVGAGVGARAFAFAGNHTAVASDISAAYWNPAALAFLPVREFQASFDMTRTFGSSEVGGEGISPFGAMGDVKDRLRLRGIGAMTAIPTVQGGLTLVAAYESPFVFDDFSVYGYNYDFFVIRAGNPDSTSRSTVHNSDVRYGDIDRWSAAFGVQIAPKIAAGLTVSIISGGDRAVYNDSLDGEPYNDLEYRRRFLGYAMTGGFLYLPTDYLKLGFNINAMMSLGVSETGSVKWSEGGDWRNEYGRAYELSASSGRAHRAPYGSIGAGLTLPWLTAALDVRFTMPYTFILPGENIPEASQARYFKAGAGVGLEAPVPALPLVLRAGYSFDQCDYHPIVPQYGDNATGWIDIDWTESAAFTTIRNKHTLSFGTAVFTSGVGFELSYGYQAWGMMYEEDGLELKQMYSNHRGMAALIFRY